MNINEYVRMIFAAEIDSKIADIEEKIRLDQDPRYRSADEAEAKGAEPMPEDTIKPTIKENPHVCSAGGACVFSVSQGLKFGTCRCFAGDCRIELARARRAAFWLRERYLDLRAEGVE